MPSVSAVANDTAESPEAVAAAAAAPNTKTFPSPSPAARGLRRWRRIRRDQELPRDSTAGGGGRESSPASVESRLVLPPARPGPGGEEQLSPEVRSTGRCRGNGSSVAGRSVRSGAGEESVGDGGNGRMHWGADPSDDSILVLQRAQEALEDEIEKITAIGKELSDEFNVSDDEWSGSVHLEEPNQDLMVRINHLESWLAEASALIKEKASRVYELQAILAKKQPSKTTIESTNLLLPHCELDQLYQERMESEIQSIILTRAHQASATLAGDQMTLYQTQKSLSEDYKLLGLKLRHTESRAMVLEEMAEKLQLQCKDLSNSSEVLQLRYKASRVSLFCFLQFLLLCIAMGTYLMRLSPLSTKVVPT